MEIKNIAIIAHVDHGKTTLVDHLLKQSGVFRENEQLEERMMDSMDIERERGITIAAKNASFIYKDTKVNIVDTPGHSDFGGEVERILDMVDGAILLVDASEGPLPQTRFVLKKALEQNKRIILCINKVDRKDARADEVLNEAFDLFIELDATEEQADFKTVYAIARDGKASLNLEDVSEQKDLSVLFDLILSEVPPPKVEANQAFKMLVTNIGYNSYVGRLAIGRIQSGHITTGTRVNIHQTDGKKNFKVTTLFSYNRNQQVETQELQAGDIAILAGFEDLQIGDTIADLSVETPLPRIAVDEPTVGIFVSVNNGPFAGLEGDHVTSRKIKDRLEKELLTNVSLRLEDTESPETFKLIARGELQIAILLEQMRREGYEVLVSQPQVILKTGDNGEQQEPYDLAFVDAEDVYMGSVTQKLQQRKGILVEMNTKGSGRTTAVFRIPSRGLIGYRSEFLTDTRGTGLLNTQFDGYDEYKGEIQKRFNGRMISDRKGKATGYALFNLEDRGSMFITPGTAVYKGMIIGDYNKGSELNVNVCREKKLTNVRASGTDENIKLSRVKPLSIEAALEWIVHDELIEVTPKSLRLRLRDIHTHG